MYLFIGLSGVGKTTAANITSDILKLNNVKGNIIHPFKEGKEFLERIYNLPPGSLDKQEFKDKPVLDLNNNPLPGKKGKPYLTFQDLMIEEFLFREEIDPYFSSRSLESQISLIDVGITCGVEEALIHGVRKKEEIDLIFSKVKYYGPVKVIYIKRNNNREKISDKFLDNNLEYIKSLNKDGICTSKIYEIDNNSDLDSLRNNLVDIINVELN